VLRGAGGESAAGSGGDEGSVLARAAALRFPNLKNLPERDRIDALVDHITDTAIARGELEELRLEAQTSLHELRRKFNRLPSRGRTASDVDKARREMAPDLAEQLDSARWLVDRCTEAINRMGGSDYDAASRAYTLLSG
jgi:hypothetical protein